MARIITLKDGRQIRVDRKGNIIGDVVEVDTNNLNLSTPSSVNRDDYNNQAQQESRLIDAYQIKPHEVMNYVLLGDEQEQYSTQDVQAPIQQNKTVKPARRRTLNNNNSSTKGNTQQKNNNTSSSKAVSTKQTPANKTRSEILKQDSTTITKPNPNIKSNSSKRYAITDRKTGKFIGYSEKPGSNKTQNTVQQKVNNDNSKSDFVKKLANTPKFIQDNNVNINYTKHPKHSRTSILDMINHITKPFRNKH